MIEPPDLQPVEERPAPKTAEELRAIRDGVRPVVMRGLVSEWPAVARAREGDEAIARYLLEGGVTRPVNAIGAGPDAQGRFFYNSDLTGLNFIRVQGRLETFLQDLLRASAVANPPAMAMQSETISNLLPGFDRDNRLDVLPDVEPRMWIGNRIRVAPHFDTKENVACCVAGRRRFTLFAPDQTANLYPGPFEVTPAGAPISMVDLDNPDLETYPKFATALEHAVQATLEPGDAIYIPYCWWHGVESLDPVSILVNYWWTEGEPEGIGQPYDALLHALLSLRHLPPAQRDAWREFLDYYVFDPEGKAGEHLPKHAQGVLGAPSPALFDHMRSLIRSTLS